ncbi:hypothetical protein TNCV_4396621 [Trichonephila clavipes]|uniref:Uncharacterized protein n=1 Tax=Trichonephila clavipes TaxID=2585209 RepID=A0A8X6W5A0_TRICX|nr:hypothetical protein TNCV_4396621 [Trichonephila clavipes]
MVPFRSILKILKRSKFIALEPIYTVDLVEQIQQLLSNLDPRDIPTFETFANSEPVDVFHDYLDQDASKRKGAFIQAVWTVIDKPRLKLDGQSMVPRLLPPGLNWLK